RAEDYQQLMESLRAGNRNRKKSKGGEFGAELEKFQREFIQIKEVDYFNCPVAHDAQMLLERTGRAAKPAKNSGLLQIRDYQRKSWLTRPRPEVDRVGSAWLIRRFIDRRATFVFADQPSSFPKALPFDMYGVEFSHHGEDCTFETLIKRFRIED